MPFMARQIHSMDWYKLFLTTGIANLCMKVCGGLTFFAIKYL